MGVRGDALDSLCSFTFIQHGERWVVGKKKKSRGVGDYQGFC